jgi:hypothetical protein
MALDDYLPFDPDSDVSNTDDRLQDAFDSVGAEVWRDLFIDMYDDDFVPDPDYMRGTQYSTPEEAVLDMYDRGLLGFTEIWYDPDSDTYGIYIKYDD